MSDACGTKIYRIRKSSWVLINIYFSRAYDCQSMAGGLQ